MKDFNWEEFKQGNIAVCCQTIEEEANFLQECEKRGFLWRSGVEPTQLPYLKIEELEVVYITNSTLGLGFGGKDVGGVKRTVRWEIKPKTKFTWREVFTNIKEGKCIPYIINLLK